MKTKDESLDGWHIRVSAAEESRNKAEVFALLAAYEDGLLMRDPPPTSLATGRLRLEDTTRQHVSIAIHNLAVGLRKLAGVTSSGDGRDSIRVQWAQLRQLAGWLSIEIEGPGLEVDPPAPPTKW